MREKINTSFDIVKEKINTHYGFGGKSFQIAHDTLFMCSEWAITVPDAEWKYIERNLAKTRCRRYVNNRWKERNATELDGSSIIVSWIIKLCITLVSNWIINRFTKELYKK